MMAEERAAKPGIEELVGVAVGASTLVIDPRRSETPLLRVAALGGACRAIRAGSDRPVRKPEHMSDELYAYLQREAGEDRRAPSQVDADALQAELAPLLLRAKFGGDRGAQTLAHLVRLLTVCMGRTPLWQSEEMRPHRQRLTWFCWQALIEWLDDRCRYCRGTGLQERLRTGQYRAARLYESGKVRLVTCRACLGTTRSQPDVRARVDALDIVVGDYKGQGWPLRFTRALAAIDRIARRLNRPLRTELERV